ncbi:hypothetical protein SDC9_08794 [bioreactor metagenome]|jgi:ADP-ribose pyrophosphatase YjhB (NUDIX family)|uniref:Nudix hydrolase domain-containing protein n=1 Tax=bioreactor metagenome TaxID=1076179 RepID=A0A644T8B0_9ZZZZ|nr:NUDIX domain-containing protein [Lentimicrobium sp.]MEA5109392.1 NUDIX domain-containing protein [Lentimicrobium sp.]
MYKVFYNDRPVILTDSLPEAKSEESGRVVLINSRNDLKEAVNNFLKSPLSQQLTIYNIGNIKKLLDDFISLFWYLEASGGIVRNPEGERLFIYRFGRWDLPKGKIEKREAPAEAAVREVTEETGISGQTITAELPSSYHLYDHKGKKVLKRTYWFAMDYCGNAIPVPQLEEDITEAAWFHKNDINVILGNTYASLHEVIRSDIGNRP